MADHKEHKRVSFPQASILAKLETAHPGAASTVMSHAEMLQQDEFRKMEQSIKTLENHLKKEKTFLRSIFRAFAPNRKIEFPAIEQNNVQQSWEDVGHHIRQAMRDFIEENNIDISTLDLTENEKADLFSRREQKTPSYKSIFSR